MGVFLNACYSEKQAKAIDEHVDCAIGISGLITDTAATMFAASFYLALSHAYSVKDAFDLGYNKLNLHDIPGADIPKLKYRSGVHPDKVFILNGNPPTAGTRGIPKQLEQLYNKLQNAYTQILTGQISHKEFWHVDGKSKLANLLISFKIHAAEYGIGDIDKEEIKSLLINIPILLADLEGARLVFIDENERHRDAQNHLY